MSDAMNAVITITPIEVCHVCLELAAVNCDVCEKPTCERHFAENIGPMDPCHCATCRARLNKQGGCYL